MGTDFENIADQIAAMYRNKTAVELKDAIASALRDAASDSRPFVGQTADCVPVRLGDPLYHPFLNHDLCQDHYRASWKESVVNIWHGSASLNLGGIPKWYSTREAAEAARTTGTA